MDRKLIKNDSMKIKDFPGDARGRCRGHEVNEDMKLTSPVKVRMKSSHVDHESVLVCQGVEMLFFSFKLFEGLDLLFIWDDPH